MAIIELTSSEREFINQAFTFLENPGLIVKITNLVSTPLEKVHGKLPQKTKDIISSTVNRSLALALKTAIQSVSVTPKSEVEVRQSVQGSNLTKWIHIASAGTAGAIGGFFGALALPLELPVTTGIILRGISSVADDWGHNLQDPAIQMHCMYIFALGSTDSSTDDPLGSTYLASRIAFAAIIREASAFIARAGSKEVMQAIEMGSAPIVIRFISQVATFFEIAVTEKMIAESLPILGALGGAVINASFCDYFVDAARFHFGMLHLEEKYGRDAIQKIFLENKLNGVKRIV